MREIEACANGECGNEDAQGAGDSTPWFPVSGHNGFRAESEGDFKAVPIPIGKTESVVRDFHAR
jgi:hypothetical protein